MACVLHTAHIAHNRWRLSSVRPVFTPKPTLGARRSVDACSSAGGEITASTGYFACLHRDEPQACASLMCMRYHTYSVPKENRGGAVRTLELYLGTSDAHVLGWWVEQRAKCFLENYMMICVEIKCLQVVGKTDSANGTVGVRQRNFGFNKRDVKVRALPFFPFGGLLSLDVSAWRAFPMPNRW